jgi:hypothetical protein
MVSGRYQRCPQRKAARTMAQLAVATSQRRAGETPEALEALLAEALFASTVQPSEGLGPEKVLHAVTAILQRLSSADCAAEVAAEFGDHPETAAARMRWALGTIRDASASRAPRS